MKAIAVFPGKPGSVHLAELPQPSLDEISNGRGVLVKVLRVGVDGTDKEINAAEYGTAPPGYDFLVIGHEGFGQVEAVGPNVTEFKPERLAKLPGTVREADRREWCDQGLLRSGCFRRREAAGIEAGSRISQQGVSGGKQKPPVTAD